MNIPACRGDTGAASRPWRQVILVGVAWTLLVAASLYLDVARERERARAAAGARLVEEVALCHWSAPASARPLELPQARAALAGLAASAEVVADAQGAPWLRVSPPEGEAFLCLGCHGEGEDLRMGVPLSPFLAQARRATLRQAAGHAGVWLLGLAALLLAARGWCGECVRRSREAAALQRRLEERDARLAAANGELQVFAYSVSHDLRAPLRAVAGYSEMLREDYEQDLGAQGLSLLDHVRENCRTMERIIEGLLGLSRVTRARLDRETVDLSAMARQSLDDLARGAPQRRLEAVVAEGLRAQGDRGMVHSLLENLLGNAWKFTARSEHARIEVGAERADGETVYYVRDNGAGFDPAYAEALFEPFKRLHSVAEFPGSGIGLATARRIVHRHGGRIWAEGQEGQGATFRFTLPPADVP